MRKLFKILLRSLVISLSIYGLFAFVTHFLCEPELANYLVEHNETRLNDKAPLLKANYIFDSLDNSVNNYEFRYKKDNEVGHILKTIYLMDCFDPRNGETDVYKISSDSSISIRYTHLFGIVKYELWLKNITNSLIHHRDTFFEIKLEEAKRLIGENDFNKMFRKE